MTGSGAAGHSSTCFPSLSCAKTQSGSAACSDDVLAQTRAAILQNFEKMLSPKREFFTEPGELEAHVLTVLGESSEEVTQRVLGNAVGMARHGTVNDLALYTLGMNVRVAVIPTSRIFNNTPDEKLVESVVLASVPGECDKSRVICAVLHKNHFDLGVLRTSGSVQAVFQVGKEWDDALQRLLSFIKSRSPPPEPKREDLGPRWVPPTSPSSQKASVSDEKEPSKDGRAIDWDAHARLLNGQQ